MFRIVVGTVRTDGLAFLCARSSGGQHICNQQLKDAIGDKFILQTLCKVFPDSLEPFIAGGVMTNGHFY